MKNKIYKLAALLLIAMALVVLVSSCTKQESIAAVNPFAGLWKGVYTGANDHGTWEVTINVDGIVAGNITSPVVGKTYAASGTVSLNGELHMTLGSVTSGAAFNGVLSGSSSTGTWTNYTTSPPFSGNWTGNKQ